MIRVRFTGADGGATDAFGAPGACLLDVAQGCGQPLEGTCDGQMACATCHVIVDAADFPRLAPASADEEEMLDLVPNAVRTSRLACQVVLDDRVGSIGVVVPTGG